MALETNADDESASEPEYHVFSHDVDKVWLWELRNLNLFHHDEDGDWDFINHCVGAPFNAAMSTGPFIWQDLCTYPTLFLIR